MYACACRLQTALNIPTSPIETKTVGSLSSSTDTSGFLLTYIHVCSQANRLFCILSSGTDASADTTVVHRLVRL